MFEQRTRFSETSKSSFCQQVCCSLSLFEMHPVKVQKLLLVIVSLLFREALAWTQLWQNEAKATETAKQQGKLKYSLGTGWGLITTSSILCAGLLFPSLPACANEFVTPNAIEQPAELANKIPMTESQPETVSEKSQENYGTSKLTTAVSEKEILPFELTKTAETNNALGSGEDDQFDITEASGQQALLSVSPATAQDDGRLVTENDIKVSAVSENLANPTMELGKKQLLSAATGQSSDFEVSREERDLEESEFQHGELSEAQIKWLRKH